VDAEQARPAPGPFLQVAKIAGFTQPGAMGRDDDAVAYGEITYFEGLEQPSKSPRLLLRSHARPFLDRLDGTLELPLVPQPG
jgi:hypothetical protein